jgi:hypothetical protein
LLQAAVLEVRVLAAAAVLVVMFMIQLFPLHQTLINQSL